MDFKALKKAGIFAGVFLLAVLFYMFLNYSEKKSDSLYLNEGYIESGSVLTLEQDVIFEEDISKMGIYTGTYLRENSCLYEVSFYDGDTLAYKTTLDAAKFVDNEFYYFNISPLSQDVLYRMEIVGVGLSETNKVAFMAGDKTADGAELIINGSSSGKALKVSLVFNKNIAFIAVLLLIITAAIFAICYFSFIGVDIAKLSFFAVLFFAVTCAVVSPINMGQDEERHLAKSAVTAEGRLFNVESMWEPIDWYYGAGSLEFDGYTIDDSEVHTVLSDREDMSADSFGTAATYFSFSYLPQTIGILLSKFLSLFLPTTFALMYYPARIINALAFALCVFFAIKNTKRYKLFLLAFSMMFFNIFLASSYSVDSVTNGMIILFVSYIMKFCEGEITGRDKILITAVFSVLVLTKVNYLTFFLLLFIVPADIFKNKKDKYKFIATCVGVALILFGIWTALINMQYYGELQSGFGAQLKFMADNALDIIRMFLRVPFNDLIGTLMRGFNPALALNNSLVIPSSTILFLYFLFIIEVARNYTSGIKFSMKSRLAVATVAFTTVMVTAFSLYLYASTTGSGYVDGLQPWYFLPIIILLPFLFKKDHERNKEKDSFAKVFVVASAFLMFSLSYSLYLFY